MERIPQSAPDFDQDRRRVDRAIRTFRAACIEIDGKAFKKGLDLRTAPPRPSRK